MFSILTGVVVPWGHTFVKLMKATLKTGEHLSTSIKFSFYKVTDEIGHC